MASSQQPPQSPNQDPWEHMRGRLSEDAERLFSSSEVFLETVVLEKQRSAASATTISNNDQLERFLAVVLDQSFHAFLRPSNSWSRLRITFDAFTKTVAAYPVSAAFLDYVLSFGAKTTDVDGNIGGYSRQCHYAMSQTRQEGHESAKQMISYDFCYLIRYPEKHGRSQKNPWSLRQVAVHKTYDCRTGTSNWTIIQCPPRLQTELVDSIMETRSSLPENRQSTPLDFILAGTSQNWRDYVNFLESEISALNEKACYSCVERMEQYDYTVGFSDAQALQVIRRKLFKAIEAVDQALNILSGIQAHSSELKDAHNQPASPEQQSTLEFNFNRFQNHRRNLVALADFQQGASALFLEMLDQRSDWVLRRQGEAMNRLALEANRESVVIKDLSEKMQRDSRSMRVLTSVALVYLPASLIAAIFNSNLLQLVPSRNPPGERYRIVVASQIWIFVVLTLSLTVMTVLGVFGCSKWDRFWDSRRSVNVKSRPVY